MTMPTNEKIRALGYMALSNFWYIEFIKTPSALSGFSLDEVLPIRCKSVDAPKLTNPHKEITIRGNKLIQAGNSIYGGNTLKITFYETLDYKVTLGFRAWRSLIQEADTRKMGSLANTFASIKLTRCNSKGEGKVTYEFPTCVLEDFDLGSGFEDTPKIISPSAVFMFDYFKETAGTTGN